MSTTRPCCIIEFIESFLFWVIFVTYNIGIYICIYIYKVSYIHSFFCLVFNCSAFSALHAKHFEVWKNILWNWWVDCFIARSIKWCDILGAHSESIFPFMQYFFLSRKLCFLWSPCLLLIAESISLDTSGKPTAEFFLKITSPSWIMLSISLAELNSVDWLLKCLGYVSSETEYSFLHVYKLTTSLFLLTKKSPSTIKYPFLYYLKTA